MYLAERYKFIAKSLFFLQLVTALLIVIFSVIQRGLDPFRSGVISDFMLGNDSDAGQSADQVADKIGGDAYVLAHFAKDGMDDVSFEELSFAFSVFASILISAESIVNAKSRWRVLRSSALSLESMVWMYRTRVGPFQLDATNPESNRPESTLLATLTDWRSDMVGSGDLQVSALGRHYPASVFKHQQNAASAANALKGRSWFPFKRSKEAKLHGDDHHSPVKPEQYIEWRLQTMKNVSKLCAPHLTTARSHPRALCMPPNLSAPRAVLSDPLPMLPDATLAVLPVSNPDVREQALPVQRVAPARHRRRHSPITLLLLLLRCPRHRGRLIPHLVDRVRRLRA